MRRSPGNSAVGAWKMPQAALVVLLLAGSVALGGCAGVLRSIDPAEQAAARYVSDTPPEIALFTVILGNYGVHSALLVNGDHRVVYDPAGGWRDREGFSDGDLRYAMSPQRLARYLAYSTRRGREVIIHRRAVSQEVANQAIAALEQRRPFPTGFCAIAAGRVLAQLPGFEGLPVSFGPLRLMRAFATPGETRMEILDSDGIRIATPQDRARLEAVGPSVVPPGACVDAAEAAG